VHLDGYNLLPYLTGQEKRSPRDFIVFAAQAIVTSFVETFKEFPPRQKAASFTIDQALERMSEGAWSR